MAAIPLLLLLLLSGVARCLPQELRTSTTTTQPSKQQHTCSIEGLDSLQTLSQDVATIRVGLAQQTKNAIDKARLEALKAEEESQKFESTLRLLNDSMMKELKEVKGEVLKSKRDWNQQLEKANADAKSFKEQSDANYRELRRWIALELSPLKAELEKISICRQFKARVGGLQLKGLTTGFYFYYQVSMAHSAAGAWCEERGMRLVRFETREEMKVVLENAPNDDAYWLDASDAGFTAGDFRWSDGSKVETEFWFRGNPDQHGPGKETCVFTHQSLKTLADHPCTGALRPLCEVPPEFSGCF